MIAISHKRIAIFAAVLIVTIIVAANLHLVVVAFLSQPDCVAVESAATPAKRAC